MTIDDKYQLASIMLRSFSDTVPERVVVNLLFFMLGYSKHDEHFLDGLIDRIKSETVGVKCETKS